MVEDLTKTPSTDEIQEAVKAAIARPSVSALIYGYIKEKEQFKDLTVEQWKEMEKDIIAIILGEIYPGDEIPEDQLTFTALTHSFAFMSNFIETLNRNLDKSGGEEDKGTFVS